ncbi:MAG: nucleoside-diphosphate kinase [Candidatus Aenigmarchaeota archaeon]|nr:nucleoside-diphosphate kinase [Candidatus Aenigmarchaeota archaeon]
MKSMERTLIVIKPDGPQRNLVGEIISRYERAGLKIKALKMLTATKSLVEKHYPVEKSYLVELGKKSEKAGDKITDYEAQGRMIVTGLRDYITSGPVVAMVAEGDNAIQRVREITGYTDPSSAKPGTIRGDLGEDSIIAANKDKRPVKNLVHASGNPEEAQREIGLWFVPAEVV